ncbi:MAG TPA: hypothetical protein VGN05_03755 [Parvibaculum sp.]|jgi:DNA repair exonuclease SbcCD ATPase subunit
MVESLMLIALGFLTATLFGLIAVQLVWRRAVTVTTRKLTGDLDLEEVQRNTERLLSLETELDAKEQELAATAARRAQLEGALATASSEAQLLRHDIGALQMQHDATRNDAEAHLQNVHSLQMRVDELETAARAEIDNRSLIETQIRSLGEKAARLALEMNEAVSQIVDARGLEAALTAPHAGTSATRHIREAATIPLTLEPFPTEELPNDELAEIRASLTNFDGNAQAELASDEPEDDGEKPLLNERFLADRIRALEAGVAS